MTRAFSHLIARLQQIDGRFSAFSPTHPDVVVAVYVCFVVGAFVSPAHYTET